MGASAELNGHQQRVSASIKELDQEQPGQCSRERLRLLVARSLVALLASTLLALGIVFILNPSTVYAGNVKVTAASWPKSTLDVSTGSKAVSFWMDVRDSIPVTNIKVLMQSSKGGSRTCWLSLASGTNLKGKWTTKTYFDLYHKGTWRVTEVVTYSSNGKSFYNFQIKKKSGIGGALKVGALPQAKLAAKSLPVTAKAGDTVTLKAKYTTSQGKPVNRGEVAFHIYYCDQQQNIHSQAYKVKVDSQGVATKTLRMPACGYNADSQEVLSVQMSYSGATGVASHSSQSKVYTIKRADMPTVNLKLSSNKALDWSGQVPGTATFSRPVYGGWLVLLYTYQDHSTTYTARKSYRIASPMSSVDILTYCNNYDDVAYNASVTAYYEVGGSVLARSNTMSLLVPAGR